MLSSGLAVLMRQQHGTFCVQFGILCKPHCKLMSSLGMCAGNAGRTLINVRYAKRIGLVDFDNNPTQRHGGTWRATGVAYGAVAEGRIINIRYTIKGMSACDVANPARECWCMCLLQPVL